MPKPDTEQQINDVIQSLRILCENNMIIGKHYHNSMLLLLQVEEIILNNLI